LLKKLKPKSEFSRNVLTLMTGTTIAQAIPIAISPILTRLYTPEDFGVFALFIAIVSIFGSVVNGRYELAIMLPKKDEDAINIFALGFIINISISLIIMLIILIFHNSIADLLNNKEILPWLYFIPFVVFFIGLFNILNYFNNRMKHYKDLAKVNIYKSIANAIVQLSFGFMKAGALGLISGQIVAQIVSNTKLFFNIKKMDLFKSINKTKMIVLGKKYKNFPIYSAPAVLCDIGALQMPYIFFNKMYMEQLVGYYFLATKIIFLPASLISSSISQVYLKEITRKAALKRCIMPIFRTVFIKLFFTASFFTLIFYFFSPILFKFFFGDNWIKAGEIASILSIVFFIRFIVSPLSSILTINSFVKSGSKWQWIYFIITLILFLYAYSKKIEFDIFIYYYIFIELCLYLYYLYIIYSSVKKFDNTLKNNTKS